MKDSVVALLEAPPAQPREIGRTALRRAVFLDRDGTVIAEKEYLQDPRQVELLPRAAEAIKLLRASGRAVVLATNQSGVGRGYYTPAHMHAVHDRLRALLAEEGAVLDGVYFCPHAPGDGCRCRKPLPGLPLRASEELDLVLDRVVTVGDKPCDVELGRGLGGKGVLVRTGYGGAYAEQGVAADYVADDVYAAALWILENA